MSSLGDAITRAIAKKEAEKKPEQKAQVDQLKQDTVDKAKKVLGY